MPESLLFCECEFCKISRNTFSYRTRPVAASETMFSVKQIGHKNVKLVYKSAQILDTYTKFSDFLPTKP